MADGSAPAYRFDELGWRLFQELCDELLPRLGIDPGGFVGDADWTRYQTLLEPLRLPWREELLPAPVFVLILWVPRSGAARWRREHVTEVLTGLQNAIVEQGRSDGSRSYLLVTNFGVESVAGRGREPDEVIGPDRLAAEIERRPQVRLEVPALLGIAPPEQLVDPAVATASTFDLAAAAELAKVFVATSAYHAALDRLDGRGVAVLTGPPEMGKTAIARTIAFGRMTLGWEAHECTSPDELWAAYDPDRRQVFVADDAFGSTEYSPDRAERWARDLDRILARMDDRHQLIWTSRPAPLHAALRRLHRERGLERFPTPSQVEVDAAALSQEERALILLRHASRAGLSGFAAERVRDFGLVIVEHEHFTPERIRRFATGPLVELNRRHGDFDEYAQAIDETIAEPTRAMADSFDALGDAERGLLVAMLDAPPGPVPERDLLRAMRRHHDHPDCPPAELVDRLTDHFLRVVA